MHDKINLKAVTIKMGEGHTHRYTMTNPIELINLTLIVNR